MVDKTPELIQQSVDSTIQSAVRSDYQNMSLNSIIIGFGSNNYIVPKWWSQARDKYLDSFWRNSDNLSGALFTLNAKMTTIPFRVFARDKSIKIHQKIADEYTSTLTEASQFGGGWVEFFGKFLESYCVQDNGAFAEIIGDGNKDGPIIGKPLTIATLDSSRCTRTSNPIYPVIYTDTDGRMYKLHYTRVMFQSSMPSSRADMNGVGFCAVSRCVQSAQNLIDISTYKQEKMGSRPQRQLVITQGGLDPDDLVEAIQKANASMNNQGLTRFAKTVVVGNANLPNAALELVDLVSAPDGFDEEKATLIGMVIIANALGMDAKELFPMSGTGGTKADAIIQHLKQRGKGPGQLIQIIENQIDQKYLPPFLHISFDYQDEAEDRQSAEIDSIRAQGRQRDLTTLTINTRVAREIMVEHEEISEAQFNQLELEDGRLPDGVSVETLFYSKDKDFVELLKGYKAPPKPKANKLTGEIPEFDTTSNDDIKIKIMEVISTSKDVSLIIKARQALAAVLFMEKQYEKKAEEANMANVRMMQNMPDAGQGAQIGQGRPKKVTQGDTSYNGEKLGGNKQPTAPVKPQDEENAYAKSASPLVEGIMQYNKNVQNDFLNIVDDMLKESRKEIENMQFTIVVPENAIKVNMPPITVNIPEQKTPVVNVSVEKQAAPIVNVQPPKVEVIMPKESTKKLRIVRKDGEITEVIKE